MKFQVPEKIGERIELFVDDWVLESSQGMEYRLHHPIRRGRVIVADTRWELRAAETSMTPFGVSSVLVDGDVYRLYYTWDRSDLPSLTAYAESRDGIRWEKPELGIVDFEGSKANNLIWSEVGMHNLNPFIDGNPSAGPEERYKALGGGWGTDADGRYAKTGLSALASSDGVHWKKLRPEPVITDGNLDSQNIGFWDGERQEYRAYYRDFAGDILPGAGRRRFRAIKTATSANFVDWSEGRLLDYGDRPLEQFYTNAIAPYFRAPHIFLGFPMRLVVDRKKVLTHSEVGVSDVVFMTSRDGFNWSRKFMGAYIYPGLERENWTDRNFLTTWGVVPTSRDEISMYWVEHFRHPSNAIVRGSLRTDGFVSLYGDPEGGVAITRPVIFAGNRLVLNYSTSAAGGIRAEILGVDGSAISGFSGGEAPELYGDDIAEEYTWSSHRDLGELEGKPVRVRFTLRDCHLYSFRFRSMSRGSRH